MSIYNSELLESLQTGLIDHLLKSKEDYVPQLLVNDKLKGKKVLTFLHKGLIECNYFRFSVAFVTTGGVQVLKNLLKQLETKKIKGKVLVSQYQNFTQPEALRSLLKFKNINLRIVVNGNFHAKGYLFENSLGFDLIIGSSNLTDKALCSNKEWNIKLSGTRDGQLINNVINEFENEFNNAVVVDEKFISEYEVSYKALNRFTRITIDKVSLLTNHPPVPNLMQEEALVNLQKLRTTGKNKALLISATGTGKTYLSAFDVKEFNPKKFLFIVHRSNIANEAMKSFKKVFGPSKSMGLYNGNVKEINADFLFSTVLTISKDEHLNQFHEQHFEYIVIDETHRAGAESYQKIFRHFKPKFILGMTATPERTDGFDIFKQFDHNIAYEIRLHKALQEEMVSNFHYFGVTDISVDNKILDDNASFSLLTAHERIDRIIEAADFYGCDNGCVRGLIFCSNLAESTHLSKEFNLRGYNTVSLEGSSGENERSDAIDKLESEDLTNKLDYIFTVDIFNEGVDIPKVNQIIMLRPTQSAIVFVQQLGRGLRKIDSKEYLTVIDFIGNYSNNYLVPVALYGDTTYNKDTLRKLMTSGSALIPGASTINFDAIAKERIFEAIDSANLMAYRDLVHDYRLLKYEIGKIPMMTDFFEHGNRDPFLYVKYSGSYFNFLVRQESSLLDTLSPLQVKLLELFSQNIANGKRIEEVIILQELLVNGEINISHIKKIILSEFGVEMSDLTLKSCLRNLNFEFINDPQKVITQTDDHLLFQQVFSENLKNKTFKVFFIDLLAYSKLVYESIFNQKLFFQGFLLYQKYSRKDVCRILNWDKNEQSTMYGYKIKHNTCPIFVTYHKEEDIVSSTKYEDKFLNKYEFEWLSRSRRTLKSKEIIQIKNYKAGLRICLFVKKSNDEGTDFYYIGDAHPTKFTEEKMRDDKNNFVPVVKIELMLDQPVEDNLYDYLTSSS